MNRRKVSLLVLGSMMFGAAVWPANPVDAASKVLTRSEAIKKYQTYYDDYQKDELVKIAQYREKYSHIKGSLADQIVERAIWYMENGYSVYGHGYKSYEKYGILDCSEFTMLVYKDFGFNISEVSAKYDSVGQKVEGVEKVKDGKYWKLVGTENLRPGDILTWQQDDHISHVAIFMGMVNGQPLVIGTRSEGNPTALGTVNDFRYWWGEKFHSARRVLPEGSWTPGKAIPGHEDRGPVIPKSYVLPPQKPVVMPSATAGTKPGTETKPGTGTPAPESPAPATPPDKDSSAGNSARLSGASIWTSASDGEPLMIVKNLYLRKTARLGSDKIALLKAGSTVKVISQYNKYNYLVEDQNGHIGYVTTSRNYVLPLNK